MTKRRDLLEGWITIADRKTKIDIENPVYEEKGETRRVHTARFQCIRTIIQKDSHANGMIMIEATQGPSKHTG